MLNTLTHYLNRRFHLSFQKSEYYQQFEYAMYEENYSQNRVAIFVALVIYLVYSPLTYYLVPDDLLTVTIYNFSLPVLSSILFLLFYKKITVERKNVVLLIYTIIMGITPILLLYHTDPSNYRVYFLNLVLPMVAIYVGFGISFSLAFYQVPRFCSSFLLPSLLSVPTLLRCFTIYLISSEPIYFQLWVPTPLRNRNANSLSTSIKSMSLSLRP
jgi:hypothetical protein